MKSSTILRERTNVSDRIDQTMQTRELASSFKTHPFHDCIIENPLKADQRIAIARHILDVVGYSRKLKLLSMPGRYWELEKQLWRICPTMYILAFETDRRIWEQSVYHTPQSIRDVRPLKNCWRSACGHYDVFQFRHRTYLFYADVCDFLEGHLQPVAWKSTWRWNAITKKINAVWLDPFSPLGSPFYERVLPNLGHYLASEGASSLSFSFICGRDIGDIATIIKVAPGNALEKRASTIKLLLRNNGVHFSVSRLIQYKTLGSGSLTMGTVIGVGRMFDGVTGIG